VRTFEISFQNIRTGLLIIVLSIPALIYCQSPTGKVLSGKTNSGISYANICIVGKNIGTVSDAAGNFTINLENIDENDSLRISMIGYESKTYLADYFKTDSTIYIYLNPRLYNLEEVKVVYHRPKLIKIGSEVTSGIGSGFGYNYLGSEFGIKVNVREPVRIKDLNLNVATCTFDTVTYRLNIYESVNQTEFKNILKEPVYLSFTKDKINKPVTFDLSKYSIIVEGNVLIALELFKDMGDGKLYFYTYLPAGFTYHRKAIEGSWSKASGVIGMFLNGQIIK
jgi:hypothetical protein